MEKVRPQAMFPGEVAVLEATIADDKTRNYASQCALDIAKAMRGLMQQTINWRASPTERGGWRCTEKLDTAVKAARAAYQKFLAEVKAQFPVHYGLEWEAGHPVVLVAGSCVFCREVEVPEPATWPPNRPEFCGKDCAAEWAARYFTEEPSEEVRMRYRSEGAIWAAREIHDMITNYDAPKIERPVTTASIDQDEVSEVASAYVADLSEAIENTLLDMPSKDEARAVIDSCRNLERIPMIANLAEAAIFIQERVQVRG